VTAIDGVATVRRGRLRVSHYPSALAYYLRHGRDWADCTIEEVNTIPYFSGVFRHPGRVVLLYHQLAREIWFLQMPWAIAAVGYVAEDLYTRIQARFGNPVLTVSDDSRRDLVRFGFTPEQVRIVGEAIDNTVLDVYDPGLKDATFTVLFHGSLRAMKRPAHAVRAFARYAADGGRGQLWISGSGDDAALRRLVETAGIADRVTFFGRTSDTDKLELMRRATVLVATSVKEGWGLVLTEANSMGTPGIVYDVDGLRCAAGTDNWTSPPRPEALALRLHDAARVFDRRDDYDRWCRRVLESSRRYAAETSYREFRDALFRAAAR
jgi:glycosyltransferase involved in cell wall biosynthesis